MAVWLYIFKLMSLIFGIFVRPLAYLVPKQCNSVLFIGGDNGQFRDNIKYLYLHLHRSHQEKFEYYFLTEDKEVFRELQIHSLPALLYPKWSTVLVMLKASIVIVDNLDWIRNLKYYFLVNTYKIQLWHGCSIKSLGLDNAVYKENLKAIRWRIWYYLQGRFPKYDLFLSTSKINSEKIFKPAFLFSKIIESGYPRNDIFFSTPDSLDLIGTDRTVIGRAKELKQNQYKTILYAPTFRDTGFGDDFLDKEALNIKELDDFAIKNKILIIFKIHPWRELPVDFTNLNNLVKYSDSGDVYPLLPLIDLLITDYSSIFFDFLYLNKPIIFFPYDYDKYIREDRSLKYDYNWVTPGPKCMDQKDLQLCIKKTLFDKKDEYRQKRKAIFDMSFSHKNGSASKHIIEIIQDEIADLKGDKLYLFNNR
ncbi:MAG: CDP-glycerol glycerophosphotransferase family protein [Desulfobacterales bacterium]